MDSRSYTDFISFPQQEEVQPEVPLSPSLASLFITGRDIEQEREIPLCFDQTTVWWHLDDQRDEHNEAVEISVEPVEERKRRKKS